MAWLGEKYTGRDYQLDFFGKKIHWPAIMKEKGLDRDKYLPYKKAMKFVRENYPIEPYPQTKMTQDIYDQVAEELGFDPDPAEEAELEKLKSRLKFYDALDTPFDTFHGVDGFFIYTDKQGREQICTFDVTQNPEKGTEDVKADVWVGAAPDYKVDKVGYEKWYQQSAKDIAENLIGSSATPVKSRPATEDQPLNA
jgi:hypothetical protein